MEKSFVLAIDQGTTGSTALVVDSQLKVIASVKSNYEQVYPRPGWVEHRADDIWCSVKNAVEQVLIKSGVKAKQIEAIGITNQRETTTLFDENGAAAHNFIVWQCRRSADICDELKQKNYDAIVREKTGLVLDPYFSGTKLTWLFRKHPELLMRARSGALKFGTIDSWLIFKLTGNTVFVTDSTNASRTLCMNLKTLAWDDELLSIFGVPRQCLAEIVPSDTRVGVTRGLSFLPDGIPISGVAGDQQAALFGQACFNTGDTKITYGTGSFLLTNVGEVPVYSKHGLLSSVGIHTREQLNYCLEGSAFIAGALVQWLRDGLKIIRTSDEIEALALTVSDSDGVVFIPALTGLGAPHWRPHATGNLSGITRGTTQGHIARAALEGIAFQNQDILDAIEQDGVRISELKVDGGACRNNLLMQIQSDYSGNTLVRSGVTDATGFGAALLALKGIGHFPDLASIQKALRYERKFVPSLDVKERAAHLGRWKSAIEKYGS